MREHFCNRTVTRGAGSAWIIGLCLSMLAQLGWAQPAGWSTARPITITENSGTTLTGYPLKLIIDTQSMISSGHLNADGSDLRFGTDEAGTTLLPYWIETGINTPTTTVWVNLDLPASATTVIWMFGGNPAAAAASSLLPAFAVTNPYDYSATDQVSGANTGGVVNSQRGFRFSPNQDILAYAFGKCEPSGTTRYITLFDFATQAILAQIQVSGPACSTPAQYTYFNLPQPIWLTGGTQYILELYQGASDGYYYGAPPQINSLLTFYDMRYCNGCTQNTFPTNSLSGMHYGYSDFLFVVPKKVEPAPTYFVGQMTTTTALSTACLTNFVSGQPFTVTATVDGANPTGTVTFLANGSTVLCADVPLAAGSASCTTSGLLAPANSNIQQVTYSLSANYSGDVSNTSSQSTNLQVDVLQARGVVFRNGFEDIPASCPVE